MHVSERIWQRWDLVKIPQLGYFLKLSCRRGKAWWCLILATTGCQWSGDINWKRYTRKGCDLPQLNQGSHCQDDHRATSLYTEENMQRLSGQLPHLQCCPTGFWSGGTPPPGVRILDPLLSTKPNSFPRTFLSVLHKRAKTPHWLFCIFAK